jgi:hypothetical protein
MTITAALLVYSLSQKAVPPKPQHLDFSDDLLTVELKQPDGEIYVDIKPPKFGNLIKVRTNFDDKIIKSVEQM